MFDHKNGYMKELVIFSLFVISFSQCSKNSNELPCESSSCSTHATVVDKIGLDGCGLMFELADGTLMEPERRVYVKAPSLTEDPLYHFNLKVGQTVKIDWVESKGLASICMAGSIVFITCISECEKPAN